MHTTRSITTLVLLALTPVALRAQGDTSSAQRGAPSAQTPTAAVSPSPAAVGSRDSLSLDSLRKRLVELERRQPDPLAEVAKWVAFALVGISFSVAWMSVRKTERLERSETTLRETTKELWKELLRPGETEKSLQDFVTKFEKAAGQITATGSRADATLREIQARLSDTLQQMSDIQQTLNRRMPAEMAKGQSGNPK